MKTAPNGIIGLETSFAASCTALVATGKISLFRLIEADERQPLPDSLPSPEATSEVGGPADLVLLDPEERWTFTEEDIGSKSRNTPFLGTELLAGCAAPSRAARLPGSSRSKRTRSACDDKDRRDGGEELCHLID